MKHRTCVILTTIAFGIVLTLTTCHKAKAIEGCVLVETAVAIVGTNKVALEAFAKNLGVDVTPDRRRAAEACLRKIKLAKLATNRRALLKR